MRAWFYRTLGLYLTVGVLVLAVCQKVRDTVRGRRN